MGGWCVDGLPALPLFGPDAEVELAFFPGTPGGIPGYIRLKLLCRDILKWRVLEPIQGADTCDVLRCDVSVGESGGPFRGKERHAGNVCLDGICDGQSKLYSQPL